MPINPFTEEGAKRIAQIAGQQPAPISASLLTQSSAPTLPQPQYTPMPATPTIPDLSEILRYEPSALEGEFETRSRNIGDLGASVAQESGYRAQQEQAFDIGGLKKTATDLTNRFNMLKAENDQIPLRIQQEFEGRGATAGGVAPIEAGRLRENTIQQIGISAMLNAANGNLSTALDQVDYAVRAKFEPLKAQLAAEKAQLEAITPLLEREDKRQAEVRAAALAERERLLAKEEVEQKGIGQIMLTAAQYGADAVTLQRIQGATTFEEAIRLAGPALQDPVAHYQLESAKLDIALKKAQIAQIGQPTRAEREATEKAQQAAKDAVLTLKDKLNTITSLSTHPGLNSAVGPTAVSRIAVADKFGAKQDFIGGVQQLISRDTLDTLLSLKAQGGTLGALSDQERVMLQSAASRIGNWAIQKDGKVVGYNIDEASFIKELGTLENLTQRALNKALGTAGYVTKEESAAIDAIFGAMGGSTSTSFNPQSYFQ